MFADCGFEQAEKDRHYVLLGPSLPKDNFQDLTVSGKYAPSELPGLGTALWPAASHSGSHADYVTFYQESGMVLCPGPAMPCM